MSGGRGLVWPLLLIAAGVAFLLSNFGYLAPVDIGRAVAVLWPLVLVLIGIDLAIGRRAPAVALALQVVVIAAGIGILAARPDIARPGGLGGPVLSSVTVERDGIRSANLRFTVGAGEFDLSGGATALLEASSDGPDLRQRVTREGDTADVRVEQSFGPLEPGGRHVRAKVAGDVPLSIRIGSGAGDFELDLREVTLRDLRVETGASSLTVVLPARPSGEVPVRIDAGASSIEIEVPAGVEAKVVTQGGLVSVKGRTETPGYAAARDRVTVSIQAAASSVTIR